MKKYLSVFLMSMLLLLSLSSLASAKILNGVEDRSAHVTDKVEVKIKTYVEGYKWIGPFGENEVAGTTGQSRRMEAISINAYGLPKLKYRVYVQGIGWLSWVTNGVETGTTDEKKAITAIQIDSGNERALVVYQVHVQDIGWMDWTSENSEIAGHEALDAKRMEAIKLRIRIPHGDWMNDNEIGIY